jgi:glycosyltransferase involved in cell wall biosynthesis
VSYPYSSSAVTGRGLDRYTFELGENIAAHSADVALRLVDQGSSASALAAGKKLLGFAGNVFSEPADIYHAISPIGGSMLVALRRTPLVVTVHDMIPFNMSGQLDSPLKYRVWRQCIKACVKQAAAIITPNHTVRDDLIQRLRPDPAKVRVINHGVDHEKYFHRPELARVPGRIVYLGEVSRHKGVDVLMRAFAIVKRTIPGAELLIAGKRSQDEAMLQELARSLGVQGMSMRGYISEAELPDYYATATAMVFPSRCGFGLSPLEAMACGTPVVVARALDAPEFIGDAGLLADPESPEDLARQLIACLTDARLRAQLSDKGMIRAQEFSWSKMATETVNLYREVLARNG